MLVVLCLHQVSAGLVVCVLVQQQSYKQTRVYYSYMSLDTRNWFMVYCVVVAYFNTYLLGKLGCDGVIFVGVI